MSRRFESLCLALLLCASLASAQTLAHPGWRGNGIAAEAWWKHAAFVRFDANTTFVQATSAMDAMSTAGADSLILPDPLPSDATQPEAGGVNQPFDVKFGTEDELDALLREASARRMHVLLRADLLRLAGSPGELRFWISRGIAGFDLGDITPAQIDTLRLLRGAIDRFPGKRILLAHVPEIGAARASRLDAATLHLLSQQQASTRSNSTASALEVHTAADLKTVPPSTTLVVDAQLLTSEEAREDLRRTLAARGPRGEAYSAGNPAARSTRHSRRHRSR